MRSMPPDVTEGLLMGHAPIGAISSRAVVFTGGQVEGHGIRLLHRGLWAFLCTVTKIDPDEIGSRLSAQQSFEQLHEVLLEMLKGRSETATQCQGFQRVEASVWSDTISNRAPGTALGLGAIASLHDGSDDGRCELFVGAIRETIPEWKVAAAQTLTQSGLTPQDRIITEISWVVAADRTVNDTCRQWLGRLLAPGFNLVTHMSVDPELRSELPSFQR